MKPLSARTRARVQRRPRPPNDEHDAAAIFEHVAAMQPDQLARLLVQPEFPRPRVGVRGDHHWRLLRSMARARLIELTGRGRAVGA